MNWSFLIAFGIGLAIYFVGLGVFTLIKYKINKKKFKDEMERVENAGQEELQSQDNANKK